MKKLTLLFICLVSVLNINAEIYSDTCGISAYYSLDTETGALYIYGTGSMANYEYDAIPWRNHTSYIKVAKIADGITTIGNYAFYKCSSLTSITIPNSVTSIGSSAFRNCSGLTSVTIPNSVTNIGNYAFYKCSSLTSITIPNSVTSIGSSVFGGCSGLTSVYIPNSVTNIGSYAFYNCFGLTSITIPNSVTNIGSYAFSTCFGLTSVYIPNSVTNIGSYAFQGCVGLTSITIPNSVTNIGSYAFQGCVGLTSITIPNSVTSIGNNAFYNCFGLTSVTIGSGVTSIGNNAFDGCSSLRKVIVSDIAAWCGINFSNSNSNPLFYAHYIYSDDNKEIKNINISNSVTNIGSFVFYGCSRLTSVIIGNGVTNIGSNAFDGCSGLTSVIFGSSVTSIGSNAFCGCSGLTSVTLPNSVTNIGDEAFCGCSGLTSVTLPNSVTSIGSKAFDEVDIPTIFSQIENPFTINGKTSDLRVFTLNTYNYATLYVPKGTIEKYKATDGWKDFFFIEESGTTPTPPTPEKCETPTIGYANGELTFTSSTEGATCYYSITDTDIKAGSGSDVQLDVTYNISVYAAKEGCENSETAYATLCWIDAIPQEEGITSDVAQIAARPVLVKTDNGFITVEGADERTQISAYTVDGVLVASAVSRNGSAVLNTSLQPGNATIVKIGNKSLKVIMK